MTTAKRSPKSTLRAITSSCITLRRHLRPKWRLMSRASWARLSHPIAPYILPLGAGIPPLAFVLIIINEGPLCHEVPAPLVCDMLSWCCCKIYELFPRFCTPGLHGARPARLHDARCVYVAAYPRRILIDMRLRLGRGCLLSITQDEAVALRLDFRGLLAVFEGEEAALESDIFLRDSSRLCCPRLSALLSFAKLSH